ncbi:YaeQ family protein [Porticoccus sp.]|nr:MAG: YaeQ family protein [Gammaproteobacteria bacterium]
MALKATVFKAELAVSNMDRGYYHTHALTIARHPSETDERMMVRLLAFALNANPQLQFCRGLSNDEEPDLWQKNLQGDIELWIEVGQPDERRIRKACNRADTVLIYPYGAHTAEQWWQNIAPKLSRFDNLEVYYFSPQDTASLTSLAERSMSLQATIQDGMMWFGNDITTLSIHPERWRPY